MPAESSDLTPPTHSGFEFVTEHHDTYSQINPAQWNLTGRVVLITGASRGIGHTTALSYARAGASGIAIVARSSKALEELEVAISKLNRTDCPAPKVLRIDCDVSNAKSIEEVGKIVRSTFGRLDILVNNAAVAEPNALILESDPDVWWNTWVVNMRGPYLVTRALLPLMLESEGGLKTVVNLSSIAAHMVNLPGNSSYQTSKLAMLRFGEFLDLEYGNLGILPIGVHPGAILTDMGKATPKEYRPYFIDTTALAGDFIVWLTKERREWLSARYVSSCWDVDELVAKRDEIVRDDKLKVRMVV